MQGQTVCTPGEMNRNMATLLGHLPDSAKQATTEQVWRERLAAYIDSAKE